MGWWSDTVDAVGGAISDGVGAIGDVGTNLYGSAQHAFQDPVGWGKNFFMDSNPIGWSLGAADRLTGGTGKFNSAMKNPYLQFGAGVASSFVPGLQWYAPMAIGGGMSVLGGGNLSDDLRGAGMAGLGSGVGNLGQSVASGWGSTIGSPTAAAPTTTSLAGGPGTGASYSLSGGETLSSGLLGETGSLAGGATLNPGYSIGGTGGYTLSAPLSSVGSSAMGDAAASGASWPSYLSGGGEFAAPGGITTTAPSVVPGAAGSLDKTIGAMKGASLAPPGAAGGGSSWLPGSGSSLPALMGVQAGLGAYQNLQQQRYLKDELNRRKKLQAWVDQAMANPSAIYENDPGLIAGRQRAMDDLEAQYRAQYGGTEGGAFAKDIVRTGSEYDRAALDSAINRRLGLIDSTDTAYYQNLMAGGTPGGGVVGAFNEVLPSYIKWLYEGQK